MGRGLSVSATLAAVTLVGAVATGVYTVESRYAHTEALRALEVRVALGELKQLRRDAEAELYHYERLLRQDPGNAELERKVRKWRRRAREIEVDIEAEQGRR